MSGAPPAAVLSKVSKVPSKSPFQTAYLGPVLLPGHDLGRHPVRRSDHRAPLGLAVVELRTKSKVGWVLGGRSAHRAGQTLAALPNRSHGRGDGARTRTQLDAAIEAQEHVVALDVAVDDLLRVQVLEAEQGLSHANPTRHVSARRRAGRANGACVSLADLAADGRDLALVQDGVRHDIGQRAAVHVVHHDLASGAPHEALVGRATTEAGARRCVPRGRP